MGILVSDFDFVLPPELIAQEPPLERSAARLLHLNRATGDVAHADIGTLPTLFRAGDVLVVNNTRVFPARLLGRRVPSGGSVECLLIGRADQGQTPVGRSGSDSDAAPIGSRGEGPGEVWEALMHPGQKLNVGGRVVFERECAVLHGEIVARGSFGRRTIRLWAAEGDVDAVIDVVGHVPLPPYIKRADRRDDRERYQTIFADSRGSVAAPTAGLHFTEPLLREIRARGVEVVPVTLHVGYGTFQPVRVERVEDHRIEPERYAVTPETAARVNRALDEGRRVITVGTTTTRTVEAVARANGGRLVAGAGETDLFIHPGFEFRVAQGLVTNFHVPRSSLLMLVAALAGRERVLAAYAEAIERRYRFYSYGDAMVVL